MSSAKPPRGIIGKLRNLFGSSQPVDQAHTLPRASLEAGSLRGSLKNWVPQQTHLRSQQAFERDLAIARMDELYGNDGIAKSGVNAIATNVIGPGLTPQSVIDAKMLGLKPDAVIEIQNQMEWLWSEWCAQAHYRDQLHFEDLQMIGLRSLIRNGEMLHLPVMDERPGCRFALRIQDIRPMRLRTPWDKQYDPCIHDGVEVSPTGIPVAYWMIGRTNTSNMSIFPIISYRYLKIPDPGNDGKNYCISSVSYPFFATLSKFPLKLQQVTENKDFSKKIFIFSDAHIFFLVPELFLAMQPPACPERVFFIYGCANSFLNHFLLPLLRSPP